MNEYEEDRLESMELHPSFSTERMLINQGVNLYRALIDAGRIDELEILMDAIGEFSTMASYYGIKTERLPESLGTDLVEAAQLKRSTFLHSKAAGSNEWKYYAEDFRERIVAVAAELGIKLRL